MNAEYPLNLEEDGTRGSGGAAHEPEPVNHLSPFDVGVPPIKPDNEKSELRTPPPPPSLVLSAGAGGVSAAATLSREGCLLQSSYPWDTRAICQ